MQERAYYNQGQKSHMYCMRIIFNWKSLGRKGIKRKFVFQQN